MQAYYIVPVPSGPVDPGFGQPGPPPGVWPSPGHPAHPIAPGGPPPGIWGGPWQPPQVWPQPPQWGGPVDPGYGVPRPPGTWGGAGEPMPTPPIVIPPGKPGDPPTVWPPPGRPAHPIVLPPDPPPTVWPDPPGKPPGGQTGSISNPINLPPAGAGGTQPGFWALAYFQELDGWVWVWVPAPTEPSTPPAEPKKR